MSTIEPKLGQIKIFDRAIPDIKCQEDAYKFTVEQRVVDDSEEELFRIKDLHTDDSVSFDVFVAGPQFELMPEEVLACNPPANATEFPDCRLPHIALKRRTFPWERVGVRSNNTDDPEPWLALLVLNDSEAHQFTLVKDQTFVPGKIPAELKLNPDHCTDPDLSPPSNACDQLFIETKLLNAVMPTKAELKLLCHVRQADLQDQQVRGDQDGYYSVVISNRLPESGAKVTVCLVSLEGHNDSIWNGKIVDGSSSSPTPKVSIRYHRMIVLWSWTYTAGGGGDFQGVMNTIITRADSNPQSRETPLQGRSPSPWSKRVRALLGERNRFPGVARFTCPDKTSATFETQVANAKGSLGHGIYHGPLIDKPAEEWRPLASAKAGKKVRISADDALLQDSTGTEAVGYASAFELGRLLTLGRSSALNSLMAFREDSLLRSADAGLRRALTASGVLSTDEGASLPALLEAHLLEMPVKQLQRALDAKERGELLQIGDPSNVRHLQAQLSPTTQPNGGAAVPGLGTPATPPLAARSVTKDVSAAVLDGLFGALIPDASSDEKGD